MEKKQNYSEEEFSSFLEEYGAEKKKINEAARKKNEQKHADRKTAKQAYTAWRKRGLRKTRSGAKLILEWAERFVASSEWTKIRELDKGLGRVRISEIVDYSHPSPNDRDRKERNSQYLYLNSDGEVFMHHCVKYGQSYPAHTVDIMLEHADPPVIIATANGIKDGSILQIIATDLKENLAQRRRNHERELPI